MRAKDNAIQQCNERQGRALRLQQSAAQNGHRLMNESRYKIQRRYQCHETEETAHTKVYR